MKEKRKGRIRKYQVKERARERKKWEEQNSEREKTKELAKVRKQKNEGAKGNAIETIPNSMFTFYQLS